MYVAILGRQPSLGIAELERLYTNVEWLSSQTARFSTTAPVAIDTLGGSQKLGSIVAELPRGDWLGVSKKLVAHYEAALAHSEGKVTIGISTYGFSVAPRLIQKTGILLKQRLKSHGVSIRLIPNSDTALSTATSHHNKLGLSKNKRELLVIRATDGAIIIAESIGAQNITAYARRDQGRPKRDAFVGMLPPKLAQMMINLTGRHSGHTPVLDPFCGTGVVLQEALLMGYDAMGSDLSEKMIDFSRQNIDWLLDSHHADGALLSLQPGDAMTTTWPQPIGAVVCETYLGQPFSAPPSPAKLREVRGNCDHIISTFLKNIAKQLPSGTPLCIGVPAWRASDGSFTHLPLTRAIESLGFTYSTLATNPRHEPLLYYREDQVVARELLVLTRA